jgi:hypothetical protein
VAKARALLADDHQMVVEAFKKLLEPEFEVVAVASDRRKLLQLALRTRPDAEEFDRRAELRTAMAAVMSGKHYVSQSCRPATRAVHSGPASATSPGFDLPPARGAAVVGGGTKHETSGSRAEHYDAYRCLPQVSDHGGGQHKKPWRAGALRYQTSCHGSRAANHSPRCRLTSEPFQISRLVGCLFERQKGSSGTMRTMQFKLQKQSLKEDL